MYAEFILRKVELVNNYSVAYFGHFCVSHSTIFDNKAFCLLNKHTHSNAVSGTIISSVKQRQEEDASCEEMRGPHQRDAVQSFPTLQGVRHYRPNKSYCNTMTQKD